MPIEELVEGCGMLRYTSRTEELKNYHAKFGCDYCWTVKYDQIHVLCHEVYKEIIAECAKKHNVTITHWTTYS